MNNGSAQSSPFGALSAPRSVSLLVIVLVLTALTYAATVTYDFVWDDGWLIVNNPSLREWSRLPALLGTDFWGNDPTLTRNYYRPLVSLSFFFEYHLWGLSPAGYHLTNVVLHLANTLLLYRLCRLLFPGALIAFFAAVVFGVHPVHSESVAFISGRTDLFAAFFFMLSFYLYLLARRAEPKRRALELASAAMFAAALLSKEVAAVLPITLLSYDLLLGPREDRTWRSIVRRQLPYWCVLGGYFVLRIAILGTPVAPSSKFESPERTLFMGVQAIAGYLRLLVVPYPLSAQYMLTFTTWREPAVLGAAAAVAATVALVVLAMRRSPRLAFPGIWFFATLLPVSNIVPITGTYMADRFAYLPSVGFSMLVGLVAATLLESQIVTHDGRRQATTGALCLVLVVFMALTMLRNEDWKDEYRLFSRTVEDSPTSPVARVNLSSAYYERGDNVNALEQLDAALKLAPREPNLYLGLALGYSMLGQRRQAITYGEQALALAPTSPVVHANLGMLYTNLGDYEKAMYHHRFSLSKRPENPIVHYNLAFALSASGRHSEAEAELEAGDRLARQYLRNDWASYRFRALVLERSNPRAAIVAWTQYLARMGAVREPTPFQVREIEAAKVRLARLQKQDPA